MAHYLAELYAPKPAWLALDAAARSRFFEGIGDAMSALSGLGIEAIALGEAEASTPHAPLQPFFAIWCGPDAKAIAALVAGVAASGWHEYFATVNVTGVGGDLNAHLAQLMRL